MRNIFNFIVSKPWIVIIAIFTIFLGTANGLQNFKLDASSDALVIEGDEAFKVYRETGEVFGNSDFLIITYTPNSDLFSDESLATIKSLETSLEKFETVESVLSILDAPIFFQPKVPLADLMDNLKTVETEGIDLVAAKEEILNNPVYQELIISPSGSTTAMQVTLTENPLYRDLINKRYELNNSSALTLKEKLELKEINQQISNINDQESQQRAILIAQIRSLLSEHSSSGVLFLGGASMIATDMMTFIKSDLAVFGVGVAWFFASCFFCSFKMYGLFFCHWLMHFLLPLLLQVFWV